MVAKLRAKRAQSDKGFTLLEIIVSLAVMGIILVPLTASFIDSIRQANEVEKKVGSASDAQRIASWWTKDVHSVEPTGVTDAELCRSSSGNTSATDVPLISFRWDSAPSSGSTDASGNLTITAKSATWVIIGQGPRAQLVRRYCENERTISETLVADSFWESPYDADQLVYGRNGSGNTQPIDFCDRYECTITVSGTYKYSLTVERRVPGLADPVSSTPPPPVITGAVGSNKALTVSWLPSIVPDGMPPVTQYDVVVQTVGGSSAGSTSVSGESLAAEVDSLINGTDYMVKVRARNSNGPGDYSPLFGPVQPQPEPPGAPTAVTAVPGDASAQVSWTPPTDDGGAAITSWQIRARNSQTNEIINQVIVSGGNATTAPIAQLQNGIETFFTVSAINSVGEGNESDPSAAVLPCGPASAPGKPTVDRMGTLVAGDWIYTGQFLVTWQQPENNGGCPVTRYEVAATPQPGGASPSPWQSEEVALDEDGFPVVSDDDGDGITEPEDSDGVLEPRVAKTTFTTPTLSTGNYQFQVRAITRYGFGASSALSDSIDQGGTPTAAPTDVAWEPKYYGPTPSGVNLGGNLTWTPLPNTPQFNGGFSIKGYQWTIERTSPTGGTTRTGFVQGANSTVAQLGDMTQIFGSGAAEEYGVYSISVQAVNEKGYGVAETLTGRKAGGRPLASPDGVTVTSRGLTGGGGAVVRATWNNLADTPENNGGRSIEGYTFKRTSPSQANISDYGVNGQNLPYSDLDAVQGREYTVKIATRNASGLSLPPTSVTYTAPSELLQPASSAVTVSRPTGLGSNQLSLTFLDSAFTTNAANPNRTYSATCTSPGKPDAGPFTNLTSGTNVLDSPQLLNGSPWTCTLTARMDFPDSSFSQRSVTSSSSATPYTTPGAPQSLTRVAAGGGKVKLDWLAANNGGRALDEYEISVSPAVAGFPTTVTGTTLTYTSPALNFGSSYTFSVRAKNEAGYGPAATTTAISITSSPPIVAPTNLDWEPIWDPGGNHRLRVTWTPVPNTSPSNGGLTIDKQILNLTPAPTGPSPTPTPVPVEVGPGVSSYEFTTNQLSGQSIINYTVGIRAHNADGNGPEATTTAKSGGRPLAAVTNLTAQGYAANGAIQVDWTPIPSNTPKNNGGKAIEGYNVYWKPTAGGAEKRTFVSGIGQVKSAIGGLTPGTTYTFRVVATSESAQSNNENVAGVGDSATWATVTWMAPDNPTAQGSITLVRHPTPSAFGRMQLTFSPFTLNAGSPPISDYTINCASVSTPTTTFSQVVTVNVTQDVISPLANHQWSCTLTARNFFVPSSSYGSRTSSPPIVLFSR